MKGETKGIIVNDQRIEKKRLLYLN